MRLSLLVNPTWMAPCDQPSLGPPNPARSSSTAPNFHIAPTPLGALTGPNTRKFSPSLVPSLRVR
ncbi:hypothetical protein EMPG_14772 [Blastomyces silverae]|uniref:Uncharacterized protein n=1 Tax=Blastomyces silverae TaxID=2060906 RepID=A0A0H1BFE3_9EURO|nr:hypothetical protein EMPG_14772 [Blastomyces silverae]